jgi:hypothetical protein
MIMRNGIRAITIWMLVSLPAVALGWNDAGHMLIALIAYDELSAPAQQELVQALHAHPRFEEDFDALMPRRVRSAPEAEQNRWLFAFAATWPDIARRFEHVRPPEARDELMAHYHRPQWHFINLPVFLNEADGLALGRVESNQSFDWTEAETSAELNIVQALGMLVAEYHAPATGDAERAVMLSWLLHLLGDLHQPLHTTALFTSQAFPRGDRGGNRLALEGRTTLHHLWDGALGSDRRWGSLLRQLERFQAVAQPEWPGEELAGHPSTRFAEWAREGHGLAARHAYVPEILEQVAAANQGPRQSLRIQLPGNYREQARAVSEVQLLLAGWRTAWLLEQLANRAHLAARGQAAWAEVAVSGD